MKYCTVKKERVQIGAIRLQFSLLKFENVHNFPLICRGEGYGYTYGGSYLRMLEKYYPVS